jgi:hypothetical protein
VGTAKEDKRHMVVITTTEVSMFTLQLLKKLDIYQQFPLVFVILLAQAGILPNILSALRLLEI